MSYFDRQKVLLLLLLLKQYGQNVYAEKKKNRTTSHTGDAKQSEMPVIQC